jgi:mannosyl-3-phosphoglycerate phosphatase
VTANLQNSIDRTHIPPRAVLFTDLDGTLLDFDTYQPSNQALDVVAELAQTGIVTIPVTSKTAAEVSHLARAAAFPGVGVVEGGAVILLPAGTTDVVGTAREELVEVLRVLQGEGWPFRGFSDMTVDEVGGRTGLSADDARRAMDRLASEPCVATRRLPSSFDTLARRVGELNAAITRGGRFWHLLGSGIDKGRAVSEALSRLDLPGRVTTGGVGDAWNDLAMLERVDRGYLLGGIVGSAEVPKRVRRIVDSGPGGFVQAARDFQRFAGEAF